MSATAPLFERLATLEHQIAALQQRIVQAQLELKDTVDLEQTVAVLMETHRTYSARLAQVAREEALQEGIAPQDWAMIAQWLSQESGGVGVIVSKLRTGVLTAHQRKVARRYLESLGIRTDGLVP